MAGPDLPFSSQSSSLSEKGKPPSELELELVRELVRELVPAVAVLMMLHIQHVRTIFVYSLPQTHIS